MFFSWGKEYRLDRRCSGCQRGRPDPHAGSPARPLHLGTAAPRQRCSCMCREVDFVLFLMNKHGNLGLSTLWCLSPLSHRVWQICLPNKPLARAWQNTRTVGTTQSSNRACLASDRGSSLLPCLSDISASRAAGPQAHRNASSCSGREVLT